MPSSLDLQWHDLSSSLVHNTNMADSAMDVDAPVAEPKGKTKDDGKADKKRFEVKKVRTSRLPVLHVEAHTKHLGDRI